MVISRNNKNLPLFPNVGCCETGGADPQRRSFSGGFFNDNSHCNQIDVSVSDNKRKVMGSLRIGIFHYVIVFCMSMWFVEIAYLFKGCKALPGAAKNKFNKCISLRMSNNKYGSTPFAPTIVKTLLIN